MSVSDANKEGGHLPAGGDLNNDSLSNDNLGSFRKDGECDDKQYQQ